MNQVHSLLNSFFYDDNKFHHNYSQHAWNITDGNTVAIYLLIVMLIYWISSVQVRYKSSVPYDNSAMDTYALCLLQY